MRWILYADVPPPRSRSGLSRAELEALVLELFGEVAALKQLATELRAEIAHLKDLPKRARIGPSGMDKGTEPAKRDQPADRRGRGKITPRVAIEEQVVTAPVPPGSRFKGYEPFLVQDLVISVHASCYQRERWITPGGGTILAPMPARVAGHFGAELRRFVLMQYHQGQSTLPRLLVLLRSMGVAISQRQLQRLLTAKHDGFIAEARDVLRAGLATSSWVSVDDTGARHAAKNGFCTQIGDDRFTWFGTRASKSRVNFLDHRIKSGDKLAACRAHRLRVERRRLRLHAQPGPADDNDRAFAGPAGDTVCRPWRLAGASRPARADRIARHTGPRAVNHRGRIVGQYPRAQVPVRGRGPERQSLPLRRRGPGSSTSVGTRCAGCTPSGWCTSWTLSTITSVPRSSRLGG